MQGPDTERSELAPRLLAHGSTAITCSLRPQVLACVGRGQLVPTAPFALLDTAAQPGAAGHGRGQLGLSSEAGLLQVGHLTMLLLLLLAHSRSQLPCPSSAARPGGCAPDRCGRLNFGSGGCRSGCCCPGPCAIRLSFSAGCCLAVARGGPVSRRQQPQCRPPAAAPPGRGKGITAVGPTLPVPREGSRVGAGAAGKVRIAGRRPRGG